MFFLITKGFKLMPSDKFLSYSKFNKKYIDPIINNKSLINFNHYVYYTLLTDSGIDSVRDQYILPHPAFSWRLKEKYETDMFNYSFDEKQVFIEEYRTILKFLLPPSYNYLLYPYSLSDFINNFYSDYIPSERDYIVNSLLELNYIIPLNDYILLSPSKLSRSHYSVILDNWKKQISLNRIVDLMKEAQDILHAHKRDLSFLINKVDELSEENKNLKQQNIQLTNNVIRANQITWS